MPDDVTPPLPDSIYVCVDIEASGPVPNPYNLVSLGAVAVLRRPRYQHWSIDESAPFYMELRPLFPGFDDGAMAVHGIPRRHLEEQGTEAGVAMRQFAAWATARGGNPVFVGHNAVFDWAFVNYYFQHTGVRNPFGWKALDSKSLAAGVLGIPFLETSKENLARILPELEPENAALKHRADYDALYQARILRLLLERGGPRT